MESIMRNFINLELWKDITSTLEATDEQMDNLMKKYPHSDYVRKTDKYPNGFVIISDEPSTTRYNPLTSAAKKQEEKKEEPEIEVEANIQSSDETVPF